MEEDLVKELEKYREKKDLSQEEIARLLQVSFITVNRWLTERDKPSRESRKKIRKLIGRKI